ncbi:MAG: AlwI family type II restriction endonuclease [Prevotella sp.]|nr:AlwI family type II restriction endonuclease [Prevotella sp.]
MNNNYIPLLPFPGFKWKWACLQCTEGINDPVVLLGVLFRMAKLEGKYKYSSDEFASELISLSDDLIGSGVNVDLRGRTGERNIIRNSGQYWKALNLIPSQRTGGIITLTDFGRKVANHQISQTEFSAQTIVSFKLPNRAIQSEAECKLWENAGLEFYPLKLILGIVHELAEENEMSAYITTNELVKIIIPLSGTPNREIKSYVDYILKYRSKELNISSWPNCCPEANDFRIAREYLLFLSNYGYLFKSEAAKREEERYTYNFEIDTEIQEILKAKYSIISTSLASDTERKIVYSQRRPNQAKFRKAVLEVCKRCVVTNVEMPEVLEAAHIKPYKYKGEDTAANGFAMRMDIHYLFDSGHLRISVDGEVFLSDKARWSYGATIPPKIFIPDYVNREFIRWRWENYNGL